MTRRSKPSVNAGSMADIAFLLLIFFLVSTTIETDQGINRTLPPITKEDSKSTVRERNVFIVELNQLNELLVEGEKLHIHQLKDKTIAFLDNGGGENEEFCDYCKGERSKKSSDNPERAVISFKNSRETDYATYIAVQNELLKAYNELKDREAQRLYGVSFADMTKNLKDNNYNGDKSILRDRIKKIKLMYPEKIAENESTNL